MFNLIHVFTSKFNLEEEKVKQTYRLYNSTPNYIPNNKIVFDKPETLPSLESNVVLFLVNQFFLDK